MGRRPYCFDRPELAAEHYEQSSATLAVYADRSEAYRSGRRGVKFPLGTYPPPVLAAA